MSGVVWLDVAALVTGGKDSALALYRAIRMGYNVRYLVAMIPRRADSWMFHYPNIRLTSLFSEACGIPLIQAETEGVREEELKDLRRVIGGLDVDGVVSGAVASTYQKSRIDRLCEELGLVSISPLWGEDQVKLMRELINLKFDVMIVGVYAYGLDRSWLGRRINEKTLDDLIELNRRLGISVVGEGGKYETLVLDAPYFKKRIRIVEAEEVWDGQSGYLMIRKAELIDKDITKNPT